MTPPVMPTFEDFERKIMSDPDLTHEGQHTAHDGKVPFFGEEYPEPPPLRMPMLKWLEEGGECILALGPSIIPAEHLSSMARLQLRVLQSYLAEILLAVNRALKESYRAERHTHLPHTPLDT